MAPRTLLLSPGMMHRRRQVRPLISLGRAPTPSIQIKRRHVARQIAPRTLRHIAPRTLLLPPGMVHRRRQVRPLISLGRAPTTSIQIQRRQVPAHPHIPLLCKMKHWTCFQLSGLDRTCSASRRSGRSRPLPGRPLRLRRRREPLPAASFACRLVVHWTAERYAFGRLRREARRRRCRGEEVGRSQTARAAGTAAALGSAPPRPGRCCLLACYPS